MYLILYNVVPFFLCVCIRNDIFWVFTSEEGRDRTLGVGRAQSRPEILMLTTAWPGSTRLLVLKGRNTELWIYVALLNYLYLVRLITNAHPPWEKHGNTASAAVHAQNNVSYRLQYRMGEATALEYTKWPTLQGRNPSRQPGPLLQVHTTPPGATLQGLSCNLFPFLLGTWTTAGFVFVPFLPAFFLHFSRISHEALSSRSCICCDCGAYPISCKP